jgi:HSP20 family protein
MALLMKPEPFSQEVNRLFNTLFDESDSGVQRWVPAMDLSEADDHFVLRADLPGLGEDDVSIEIQDNTLTIYERAEVGARGAQARLVSR